MNSKSTAAARPLDPGRELWLQQRRGGVGASDAAAILGVHPYKTAFDVWLEKTGEVPDRPPTKPMEWGLRLEDAIAQKYSEETGRELWTPDRIYQHAEYPFICCTPDRLVIGEERGLEIKTADSHVERRWGAEHTDEIPREYIVQCAHSMAVLDYDVWDVAVLIGGNDDRIHTIRRDRAFEKLLIERLAQWWDRHIVRGEQPKIEGGEGVSTYLRAKYPSDNGKRISATEEVQEIGEALASVRARKKALEEEEDEYKNQLISFCGDAAGIDADGWRATFTGGNKKVSLNHEALAQGLMERMTALGQGEAINEELAKARFEKLTPRSFRFTAGK